MKIIIHHSSTRVGSQNRTHYAGKPNNSSNLDQGKLQFILLNTLLTTKPFAEKLHFDLQKCTGPQIRDCVGLYPRNPRKS